MDCIQQKPHAILVCFPLQGHLNPAVQLAIKLASKGFTITFINTQSIHHQITSNTQKDNDEDIFSDARKSGLDIHYTTVSDGLPLEFDRSLNHDQFMAAMFHVFSAHIDEAVQRLMESGPPVSCLIADSFLVQLGRVAKKHGLLYASFWTQPATVFTIYYHLDLLRLNGHFDCIGSLSPPLPISVLLLVQNSIASKSIFRQDLSFLVIRQARGCNRLHTRGSIH